MKKIYKYITLVLLLICINSCVINKYRLDKSYIYKEFGDSHIDDCKDVYTQVYAVTIYNDTLPIRRIYSTDCFEKEK